MICNLIINKRAKGSQRQMSIRHGVFFRKVNRKYAGHKVYRIVHINNRYKKIWLQRDGLRFYTVRRIQKMLEGK